MLQNFPLSNMQLELLNLFNRSLSDEDLQAIKRLITAYLAEKLTRMADEVWEEKAWTDEDMEEFLQKHLRTPYQS